MTDKEKAKEYAMQHSCPAINDGCIAVYEGVLCGIAEGRKEGARDIEVLTEENEELKKEKIPHLERRIACNRGNVRVLNEKLKCRLEQVERLKSERNQLREEKEQMKAQIEEMKKENAELKSDLERWKNRCAEIYWDS